MDAPYTVIRSRRRTIALEISREGRLILRAPYGVPEERLRSVVNSHGEWIRRHLEISAQRRAAHPEPTEERRVQLIRAARDILPRRVEHYAAVMGLRPSGITITSARTRFGSCSPKNRLSFSWRLMDYPPEAVDYVVVHELAHIRHHDHSPAFYDLVASVLPDHRERRALLR